jgi:hypothetical protein
VHKYFNPYDTPCEGFITFMNVLNDMVIRVRDIQKKKANAQVADAYSQSAGKPGSFAHSFISEHPSAELINMDLDVNQLAKK